MDEEDGEDEAEIEPDRTTAGDEELDEDEQDDGGLGQRLQNRPGMPPQMDLLGKKVNSAFALSWECFS